MRRTLPLLGLLFLVSACGTGEGLRDAVVQSFSPTVPTDPARDTFGVTAPVEPTEAATTQGLDWKVSQLCTNGADPQQQTTVPAEDGREIALRTLTCKPYRLSVTQ
jgi:hypothetical protein